MTKEREQEIKKRHKAEHKNKMHDSIIRLAGLISGLAIIIGIIVVVALMRS